MTSLMITESNYAAKTQLRSRCEALCFLYSAFSHSLAPGIICYLEEDTFFVFATTSCCKTESAFTLNRGYRKMLHGHPYARLKGNAVQKGPWVCPVAPLQMIPEPLWVVAGSKEVMPSVAEPQRQTTTQTRLRNQCIQLRACTVG